MSDKTEYAIVTVPHDELPDVIRDILDSDDDGGDRDTCSCGHDWSSNVESPPLPESEASELTNIIRNWDTSKMTNIEGMFSNTKTIVDISEDGLVVRNSAGEIEHPSEYNFGENASIVLESSQAHVEDVVDCSLVLIKRGNKYLGVSRKHDHNDIGLPGGKREAGESFEDCAQREATEETDFIVTLLQDEPYKGMDMGLYCQTYLAEITGKVAQARDPSETGIVDWFDKQAFIDGTFGEYNTAMFKHFGL